MSLRRSGFCWPSWRRGGADGDSRAQGGACAIAAAADDLCGLFKAQGLGGFFFEDADCVCFVPMTKKAERKRGYNQSKLLAESVGEKLNVPVISTVIKINDTAEQKNLSVKERVENLEKSFKKQTQTNLKY